MRRLTPGGILVALTALSAAAAAPRAALPGGQDWPMWGGTPQRNMTSRVTGLPEPWDVNSNTSITLKAQIGSTSNGNPVADK